MADSALTTKTDTIENSFLAVIERASIDPNVDIEKMQQILDMQERIMDKNASQAFNVAMSKAQLDMPVIPRSTKAHNSNYATYEDLDKVARPIYSSHGFSVSYDTRKGTDGMIVYLAKVRHIEGHIEIYEREFGDETSGSKNAIQAKASAETYAKRYLLQGIFNIVTCDEDDDGNMSRTAKISEEQESKLEELINDVKADREAFLEYMDVSELKEIPADEFNRAKTLLNSKKKEVKK